MKSRLKAWRKLRRREQRPLRLFLKSRIPAARAAFDAAAEEAWKVAAALAQSEIRIDFQLGSAAAEAYAELARAHADLARSVRIWDVTSSVGIDRKRARSVASSAITRTPIALTQVNDSIVASAQVGLRFGNANGDDLDLFPGLLLMRARGGHDYALVDLRRLRLEVQPRAFVEDETVPSDARVIDQAWAKANRDGSPDRRFRDNRQIPVVRYGELRLSTPEGMAEAYHASNCEAALAFGAAFHALQAALARQAETGFAGAAEPTAVTRDLALPELPAVGAAHELTILGLIAPCAGLALWLAAANPPANPPATLVATGTSPAEPPQVRPDAPLLTVPSASSEPETALTTRPDDVRTRVTTLRAANLRERPDAAARVLRVLAPATNWTVFDRQGVWVQVGEGTAAGWVHNSLLRPGS